MDGAFRNVAGTPRLERALEGLQPRAGLSEAVQAVAFSSDGRLLGGNGSLAFAPDGTLATGSYAGIVQLWNLSTGREVGHLARRLGSSRLRCRRAQPHARRMGQVRQRPRLYARMFGVPGWEVAVRPRAVHKYDPPANRAIRAHEPSLCTPRVPGGRYARTSTCTTSRISCSSSRGSAADTLPADPHD